MNCRESCQTGQFRLGSIAGDERLSAGVLGGSNMDKTPSARRVFGGKTGA